MQEVKPKQPVGSTRGITTFVMDSSKMSPIQRNAYRKHIYAKKRWCSKMMTLFSTVGILLMMFETEMCINNDATNQNSLQWTKSSPYSIITKLCITISTFILVATVGYYHMCEMEMYLVDNGLDDWRLAMEWRRVAKIVVEMAICFIHPPPGNFDFYILTMKDKTEQVKVLYPVDVALSIPMFLRVFVYCRFVMLHSPLFSDAKSQSLGALNRIHFDFPFIFKSFMAMHPGRMLALIIGCIVIIGSWSVRACEMYNTWVDATLSNSLWMILITVLTVGYGDITPHSYCGRTIAVTTGILGVATTALVVAVIARKLELSRAEKYVQAFVVDIHLEKKYKGAAADILKEGWKIYKWRKRDNTYRVRLHQRKLLKAIATMRKVKEEQNRMKDGDITLAELGASQANIYEIAQDLRDKMVNNTTQFSEMEKRMSGMEEKLSDIHTLVMSRRPPTHQSSQQQ